MSHAANNWLASLEPKLLTPAQFRIMYFLCDCHNPERGCFPSQSYLMHKTGLSNGGINKCLKILEEKGLLTRTRRVDDASNKHRSTIYTFPFDTPLSGEGTLHSVEGDTPLSGERDTPLSGDKPVKDEPVNKFNDFWASYPKRTGASGKALAEKAFEKASKSYDVEMIIRCAVKFAKERSSEDPKFTPMAATWLNQSRFLDFEDKPDEIEGLKLSTFHENQIFENTIPSKFLKHYQESGMEHSDYLSKLREVYKLGVPK